jgi:gas vesicle protein
MRDEYNEYENEDNSSGLAASISAFLLGLGVGVGVSMLLTPRSGEENRQLIADKAREGVDRASLAIGELKDQVQVGIANAGDAAQDLKDRVGGTVADLKDRVNNAVRAGQEAYTEELRRSEAEQEIGSATRAATSGSTS